jgi:hypothetical protein
VESNDKNFARVKVLRTLCERIEAALEKTAVVTETVKTKQVKVQKSNKDTKPGKASKTSKGSK